MSDFKKGALIGGGVIVGVVAVTFVLNLVIGKRK